MAHLLSITALLTRTRIKLFTAREQRIHSSCHLCAPCVPSCEYCARSSRADVKHHTHRVVPNGPQPAGRPTCEHSSAPP
eukprot:3475001-Prymnesium_polylepis.1